MKREKDWPEEENDYPNCSLCKWLAEEIGKNMGGWGYHISDCKAQANQTASVVYGNEHCKKVYEKIPKGENS